MNKKKLIIIILTVLLFVLYFIMAYIFAKYKIEGWLLILLLVGITSISYILGHLDKWKGK